MIVEKNNIIYVFTDGGARFNSKDGEMKSTDKCGCAFTLEFNGTKKIGSFSGFGYSNNQMELIAILFALKEIKNKTLSVIINTDSKYAINCLTKWCYNWEKNGWKKKDGSEILNIDIIKKIYYLLKEFPFLEFNHVKGHSGIEGNEEVDQLLNEAMDKIDTGENIFPVFEEVKYV